MQHHPDQEETKQRLLSAAGEIFSAKGFARSTIREICAQAQANVAAVNYHFGGKQGLYEALLEHCHQEGLRRHPPTAGLADDSSPEEALEAYVRSFLNRTLGEGRPAWSTQLMATEMSEPSPALEHMVQASMRPNMERLMTIVARLLGDDATEDAVRNCALSVVGQCQHHYRARAAIKILFPDVTYDQQGIDILVRHVVRFSLAAIRGYRQEGTNETS